MYMRPKIITSETHGINVSLIDAEAIAILSRLQKAHFSAYLVGGSVRDLLRRHPPKDYDISTSARPEEIKALFGRSCILIGRRFRLAHIRYGHKIYEVATFRSGDNDSALIIRDNEWGSAEEDVLRRDFTINGLFFNPFDKTLIDYVGGWEDLHQGLLRSIGDPEIRFKQDPVRMIRLLKFQARLQFTAEEKTRLALLDHREEIVKSSPARVLEELLRMLESGVAKPFFRLMEESKLLELIMPHFSSLYRSERGPLVDQFLLIADQMNHCKDKLPLERSLLLACLFFPILEKEVESLSHNKERNLTLGDLVTFFNGSLNQFFSPFFMKFPKLLKILTRHIIWTQYRLPPLAKKHPPLMRLFKDKDFGRALQFLKIRALIDPSLFPIYSSYSNQYRHFRHGKG